MVIYFVMVSSFNNVNFETTIKSQFDLQVSSSTLLPSALYLLTI